MAHQRQVIRKAMQQALIDAGTAAAGRVYATRVVPLRRTTLPAIAVYTLSDTVRPDSLQTAPRELTRDIPVVVEGWVAPGDNPDDAMDALALEIENALHADPYLDGDAAESILDDTVLEVVEVGDRLVGMVALTYSVTYRTLAPEPPADDDLDDFETVEATHDLDGEDDAVDLFTVEESP